MPEPDVESVYMSDLLRVLPGAEAFGVRVYHSTLVSVGQMLQVNLPGYGPQIILGTRPLTLLEEVRRDARQTVRDGLARWLEWLDEPRKIEQERATKAEIERLYALLEQWRDRAVPVEAQEPYQEDYALERGVVATSPPRPETFVDLNSEVPLKPWWDPFTSAVAEGVSWAKD